MKKIAFVAIPIVLASTNDVDANSNLLTLLAAPIVILVIFPTAAISVLIT